MIKNCVKKIVKNRVQPQFAYVFKYTFFLGYPFGAVNSMLPWALLSALVWSWGITVSCHHAHECLWLPMTTQQCSWAPCSCVFTLVPKKNSLAPECFQEYGAMAPWALIGSHTVKLPLLLSIQVCSGVLLVAPQWSWIIKCIIQI